MIVKSIPENVLKNKNYQNVQSSVKACMQFIITPSGKTAQYYANQKLYITVLKNDTLSLWKKVRLPLFIVCLKPITHTESNGSL